MHATAVLALSDSRQSAEARHALADDHGRASSVSTVNLADCTQPEFP